MSIKLLKSVVGFLIIALAVTCLPAGNGFAADKEIVLKALSPWAKNYYWTDALVQFQKMVNDRLKGRVRVNYMGGNEIIPTLEQFEGLRNGVVDVILGCGAYYKGQVPEASTQLFTHVGPIEQRENGYYDLLRKIHLEKGNVILLSNLAGNVGSAFRLYTNTKTDKPDLSGLKVRVSSVYVALVKALGGAPVSMPPSELYAALERHVVGAYGQSYGGIEANGWHEVTKYAYKQGFYSANFAILFNVEVWNKLPQDVRNELEEIGKDTVCGLQAV